MELFIIFPAVILTLIILVIIDRIGTVRTPRDDEEEEV